MDVGLWPIGNTIENIALMKLGGYHVNLGDQVRLSEPGEINYISIPFSKDRAKAETLARGLKNVVIGGTGWEISDTLPPEIEATPPNYSIYPGCNYSIGFTSRGCDSTTCRFCVVQEKEGPTRSVATIADILRPGTDMVVLLDNDLLSNPNYPERLAEIRERGLWVNFNQALNIKKINDFNARLLSGLNICNIRRTGKHIHFAFDKPEYEPMVRQGVEILAGAGIKAWRLMFYMLVGCDTTWQEDMARFKIIVAMGCHPYVMRYQPINAAEEARVAATYTRYELDRLQHFGRWINWRVYKVQPDFEKYEWWIKCQERQAKRGPEMAPLF